MSRLLASDKEGVFCRVVRREHTVRGKLRGPGGGRRRQKQRAGQRSTEDWGAGQEEERTENMERMVVTLEVSKLSGWLNADALCQHAVPGEIYRSARAGGGGRPRCKQRAGQGSTADSGHRVRGGAHGEHAGHDRDAESVEAQRLVER